MNIIEYVAKECVDVEIKNFLNFSQFLLHLGSQR